MKEIKCHPSRKQQTRKRVRRAIRNPDFELAAKLHCSLREDGQVIARGQRRLNPDTLEDSCQDLAAIMLLDNLTPGQALDALTVRRVNPRTNRMRRYALSLAEYGEPVADELAAWRAGALSDFCEFLTEAGFSPEDSARLAYLAHSEHGVSIKNLEALGVTHRQARRLCRALDHAITAYIPGDPELTGKRALKIRELVESMTQA